MLNIKSMLVAAVAVLPALAAGPAHADLCKQPFIVVQNDKARTIKVLKIQYFDECDQQWRTEDVPNREITSGDYTIYSDNLEYAGNCVISKFKLYRQVRNASGSAYGAAAWGAELVPDEGPDQVCGTYVQYHIHAFDRE